MNVYFLEIFDNIEKVIFIKMYMKIHFIKNFKINILIEMNVFMLYKFLLNCVF